MDDCKKVCILNYVTIVWFVYTGKPLVFIADHVTKVPPHPFSELQTEVQLGMRAIWYTSTGFKSLLCLLPSDGSTVQGQVFSLHY